MADDCAERRAAQGNRVNASCGDAACEEVVVRRVSRRESFAGGLADQVIGDVFDGGEVGWGVIGSDAALVNSSTSASGEVTLPRWRLSDNSLK